jgi:multidrug resistance efflux pump|nr:efflux RND transporter periplasmic adaptor subunit [uncultured Limnohabitans sp.]
MSIATPPNQVPPSVGLDARSLIEQLQQVRKTSTPEMDWQRYCSLMRQLCKANHCAVVRRLPETQSLEQLGRASDLELWSPMQTMPVGIDLLSKAASQGYANAPAQGADGQTWLVLVLALQGITDGYLILNIKPQERPQLNELTLRALLCVDFNNTDQAAPALLQPPAELTAMLGMAAEVMQQPNFAAACLSLVNGLAAHWQLLHASMGWVDKGTMEVVAISHLDRFERNASQTQRIESALLPAVIEGHEVWWPTNDASLHDTDALSSLAQDLNAQHIALLPIPNAQGITQAVLLLAFGNAEALPSLNTLQLALELMQPRLTDLRSHSLSLKRRVSLRLQNTSERLFGPEHPLLKLAGIAVMLLVLYMVFGSWHYRVDASAQLNTDATRLISAQFDGRIDQVHVTSGDLVKEGASLVTLDTRDLIQQRNELSAEISKSSTEVNKYRAEGLLADTEIAQARLDQAQAKAERIDTYLSQSSSHAPFEGVIVEGERKDLLGAPVKKGDRIFRIAKVEGLYITLMVSEKEMRHIAPQAQGEVALLSHPTHNIRIRVSSVIPVAQVKGQEGNQFMIKAELLETPQPWWRPGMTGLARIDVGEKNVAWVLSHRVVDRLRLLLWW